MIGETQISCCQVLRNTNAIHANARFKKRMMITHSSFPTSARNLLVQLLKIREAIFLDLKYRIKIEAEHIHIHSGVAVKFSNAFRANSRRHLPATLITRYLANYSFNNTISCQYIHRFTRLRERLSQEDVTNPKHALFLPFLYPYFRDSLLSAAHFLPFPILLRFIDLVGLFLSSPLVTRESSWGEEEKLVQVCEERVGSFCLNKIVQAV